MTPELHAMLLDWLESGTESQREHARRRLAMPDTIGYEPPVVSSYPPLLTQAATAVKAAVGFAADGFRIVDQAEQDRRYLICLSCPQFVVADERCLLCGCFMSLKSKLVSSSCPDNPPRW